MRKVIVSEMITLDGFFAGPDGEIDWHVVDEDFNERTLNFFRSVANLIKTWLAHTETSRCNKVLSQPHLLL